MRRGERVMKMLFEDNPEANLSKLLLYAYDVRCEIVNTPLLFSYGNQNIINCLRKNVGETKEMYSKWYLYAEHVKDKVRIIFADTGRGIAGTVRRKKSEKVREFIFGLKDEDLLYHAFQPGNFIRTETREFHRGNGLPGIKPIVENSPISSFWVFSGHGGLCIDGITGAKQLTKRGYLHKMYGTMVVFEFSEGGISK